MAALVEHTYTNTFIYTTYIVHKIIIGYEKPDHFVQKLDVVFATHCVNMYLVHTCHVNTYLVHTCLLVWVGSYGSGMARL